MQGKELKEIRKQLGYTQREMWTLLNTPYRTYQEWEAGRNRIPGIVSATLTYYRQAQGVRNARP